MLSRFIQVDIFSICLHSPPFGDEGYLLGFVYIPATNVDAVVSK